MVQHLLVVSTLLWILCLLGYAECQTCSEDYETLANFLVNTTDNKYKLSVAFFPIETAPPAFVKVIYHYDDTKITNQTWFWSSGAFYFFQPLQIYQFTSLLFGNPEFRVGTVAVMLPAECANASVQIMETLTQRLKLIASQKFYPVIGDNYLAKAASANTVTKSFYNINDINISIIDLIHAVQILFPLASCVLFIVCFVYYWVNLIFSRQFQAPRDTDWSTIAAYYGISLYFTLYSFGLDFAALVHRLVGVEFVSDNEHLKNLVITPFVLDLLAVVFIVLLVFIPCFRDICTNTTDEEYTGKWQFVCLSLAGLAPFLCVASHAHFILIAWITDPTYASGIGVFYGILFFVYFLTFKFVYHHCVHLLLFFTCTKQTLSTAFKGDFNFNGGVHCSVKGHLRTPQRTPDSSELKIYGELEELPQGLDEPLNLNCDIQVLGQLDGNYKISNGKFTGTLKIPGEPELLTFNLENVQFGGKLETHDNAVHRTLIEGTLTLDRKGEGENENQWYLSGQLQTMSRFGRGCHDCLQNFYCTGSTFCARFCHGTTHNDEEPGLSFVALLITIIPIGLLLTGYVAMTACFFIFIPINKSIEDTPTQVYAIYQGIIAVLTALLAYVVVVKPGSFSITKAVKQTLKKIQSRSIRNDWMKIGDEERLAEVLTKAVDVLYTLHPDPDPNT